MERVYFFVSLLFRIVCDAILIDAYIYPRKIESKPFPFDLNFSWLLKIHKMKFLLLKIRIVCRQ